MIDPINHKICIVDDDQDVLDIYKWKLEEEKFLVSTARNGKEGLEMIKKEKPDLALIDMNMPEKNGAELIQDIRKDGEISRTKIVVFTNRDDMETVERIKSYDVQFYMVKALSTPQKMVDIIKEALA